MQPSEQPMIRLDGVGKTYPDGTVAVHDLDLDVPRGSVVCLVGPSGCGKSTTVKMVNRLIEPTTGTITLDGRDVTQGDPVELRRHIGYVIQQVGLFPHQTIRTNVATVPSLLGWSRARAAGGVLRPAGPVRGLGPAGARLQPRGAHGRCRGADGLLRPRPRLAARRVPQCRGRAPRPESFGVRSRASPA